MAPSPRARAAEAQQSRHGARRASRSARRSLHGASPSTHGLPSSSHNGAGAPAAVVRSPPPAQSRVGVGIALRV